MKRLDPRLALLAAVLLLPLAAQAQSFRTYVASYGNDGNVGCTVSAPCRLLPAALSAVLDGGEVWILDSANYNSGTVNIMKSVSILAVPGQVASIVAVAGNPAFNIATANVKVALRNLVIPNNANNPGTYGILMSAGSLLSIEDCLFANLPMHGVYVHDTTARVQIKNTVMRNIDGYAVRAENGPNVVISNSQFLTSAGIVAAGIAAPTTTTVSVSDSNISNGSEGVFAYTTVAGALAQIFATRNTFHGTYSPLDSETNGTGMAAIYAGNNMIDGSHYGWQVVGTGSSIVTYGNNQFSGNFVNAGSMTLNSLQ
ncbi:MAG TPA: right-handed parallel beta-helix repeat-containing protein [Usitatibacter sp.]|nr:right-handed parallel beta-helix repeat-containing protein [Usitatibacter sp.]